ncbi:hypothetical protein QQX98_003995 [Neonectria punicea]|uniref:DUF2293 domain-containing protein n=1 Tax=Neonectria punicea TaxID=979145 RepID=A0ABR1HBA7_9HYPO
MAPKEPVVSPTDPMPKGYGFLRKGNAYLTANTRRKTHAAKQQLYVVIDKRNPLGLRAPTWILKEVHDEDRATRDRRQDQVRRRDDATEKEFETAIRKLFPHIPEEDIHKTIKRALKKRSGRVGRTGLLDLDQKVQLAVAAHVRHCHTQYDTLVRGKMNRNEARSAIKPQATQILSRWRGGTMRVVNKPKRSWRLKASATGTVDQKSSPKQPPKPPAEKGNKEQHSALENLKRRKKKNSAKRLGAKLLATSTTPSNPPTQEIKSKQQELPQKPRMRKGTRQSSRLNKTGVQDLKMLDVFVDDEDGSESSDTNSEDEDFESNGLQNDLDDSEDDFLVCDSESELDSEWDSE